MSTYSLFDKLIKWSVGLGLTATAANYSVFDGNTPFFNV